MNVNLDDFVAVAITGVLDRDGEVKGVRCRQSCGCRPYRLVVERGVAQAETEGEKGLAGEVAVGAVGHAVVGEVGEVGGFPVEGDGKPSGGVVVAEKDIGHSRAALAAGIPRLNHGLNMRVPPGPSYAASAERDQD